MRILDWMRLFRAPNCFTAVADVMMGFAVVRGTFEPAWLLVQLVGASVLLYSAGMVLNDYFDVEVDRKERPERPLPSGRISIGAARAVGFGMLIAGALLGGLAGFAESTVVCPWRPMIIVACLAGCILGYNGGLKKTRFGPVVMGACRFFNILMGMSIASVASGPAWSLGFEPGHWIIAAGIGLYVVGITHFARDEASGKEHRDMIVGIAIMILGFVTLGLLPVVGPELQVENHIWWIVLGLTCLSILRRCVTAAVSPSPAKIQGAVKQCLVAIIVIDALIVLAMIGPMFGMAIFALLAPTLLLGRLVYST